MFNHPFKPDKKDPMKVKRNFAIYAFASILSIVVYVLYLVNTGDSNTAAMLSAASGIVVVALPTLATPIVQYFYMTGQQKTEGEKDDSLP